MTGQSENTVKKSYRFFSWLILFAGIGLGFCWRTISGAPWCYHWWQQVYGKVPDAVFFRWEEYFSLMHPSSDLALGGNLLFFLVGFIFMLIIRRGKFLLLEMAFLVMIFVMMFFALMPCCCASKEHAYRVCCECEFKQTFRELKKQGDLLPDCCKLDQKCPHTVIYSGSGRSFEDGKPFIILEDSSRSHAGDLRHCLWSDGKMESYYPWKVKKP